MLRRPAMVAADTSMFDLAHLGGLGAVPGRPGAQTHPPQPMIAQTRAMLDRYAAAGGTFDEIAIPDTGHSPHLESPPSSWPHCTRSSTRADRAGGSVSGYA